MTQPPMTAAPSRPLPATWLLAVVAMTALLAVAIGSVAGSFLLFARGSGSLGAAVGYVTADATAYYELRLDLPGDQRAHAVAFLSHFPFETDAETILGDELERWLDEAMGESDTDIRYSTDIKPWFDGRAAFVVTSFPTGDMLGVLSSTVPSGIAMLGVTDRAAAEAFGAEVRADVETDAGGSFTSSTHAGLTIWTLEVPDDVAHAAPDLGFAYAVTDDQVLLATGTQEISTALDVHEGRLPGLADDRELAALLGHLPEGRVGTMAMRSGPMLAELRDAATELDPALGSIVDVYASLIPELQVGSARLEDDRVVFEGVATLPPRGMANAERDLATQVPADALIYLEGDGVGEVVAQLTVAAKAALADRPEGDDVDLAEAALGGDLETFVAWMGSTAFVAGWEDDAPYGGLVVTPTDEAQAASRLVELRALARLGAENGSGISVEESEHGGTTITSVSLETGDGFVPSIAVEFAIDEGRVLIGVGAGFVARMIDLEEADSLAADDRYSAALAAAGGTSNAGVVWLDLAGAREAVEGALPQELREAYDGEVQPWVHPFDYVIGVTVVDGELAQTTSAIVVR